MAIILKPKNSFYEGVQAGGIISLLVFAFFILDRKRDIFRYLKTDSPEKSISEFEDFYNRDLASYRKKDIFRLILGAAGMIAMFLLLFIRPDTYWAGEIFTFWIAFILISMYRSWTLMHDGMLIQDLKKCIRDHTSGIS